MIYYEKHTIYLNIVRKNRGVNVVNAEPEFFRILWVCVRPLQFPFHIHRKFFLTVFQAAVASKDKMFDNYLTVWIFTLIETIATLIFLFDN